MSDADDPDIVVEDAPLLPVSSTTNRSRARAASGGSNSSSIVSGTSGTTHHLFASEDGVDYSSTGGPLSSSSSSSPVTMFRHAALSTYWFGFSFMWLPLFVVIIPMQVPCVCTYCMPFAPFFLNTACLARVCGYFSSFLSYVSL